jgi:hypothetical protein
MIALNDELGRVSVGDTDQISGDGVIDDVIDLSTYGASGTRIGLEKVNGRWRLEAPARPVLSFGGPLAWVFGLAGYPHETKYDGEGGDEYTSADVDDAWQNQAYGGFRQPWEYANAQDRKGGVLPRLRVVDERFESGESLFRSMQVPWSPPRYYLGWRAATAVELPGQYSPARTVDDHLSRRWPVPLDSELDQYAVRITPGADLAGLAKHDIVQMGNTDDDLLDRPRCLVGSVSATGTTSDGVDYLVFGRGQSDVDGTRFEFSADATSAVSLDYGIPTRFTMIGEFSALFWCPDLDESDPWQITTDGVTATSSSLAYLVRSIVGAWDTPRLPTSAKLDMIPDVDDDEIDQLESVDWQSLWLATRPIIPYHTYRYQHARRSPTLYDSLAGELALHDAVMSYEPDMARGCWVYRFRKRSEINISRAYSEGRILDAGNIVAAQRQVTRHNDAYKYSQVVARTNYDGSDHRVELRVDSTFARARCGGTFPREIEAPFSQLPISASSATSDPARIAMMRHFSPMLDSSARDKPLVARGLTSRAWFFANVGADVLITDPDIDDVHTGERGVTSKPALITSITYHIGRDWGLDSTLALGTGGVYGWAPAMRVPDGSASITSDGATGTIAITPNAHDFTDSTDRTDLSFFANYTWTKNNRTYVPGSTLPDYAVRVIMEDDPTWTAVDGTISEVDPDAGTATLSLDTTGFPATPDEESVSYPDGEMSEVGVTEWEGDARQGGTYAVAATSFSKDPAGELKITGSLYANRQYLLKNKTNVFEVGKTYRIVVSRKVAVGGDDAAEATAYIFLPDSSQSKWTKSTNYATREDTVTVGGDYPDLWIGVSNNKSSSSGTAFFDYIRVWEVLTPDVLGPMIVLYGEWDDCEDEQRRWFCAAGDNNMIDATTPGHTWQP